MACNNPTCPCGPDCQCGGGCQCARGDAPSKVAVRVAARYLSAGNIPKKVEELVKEVKDGNPGYTDAQAWATAWSIYCKSVDPESAHCKS